MALIDDFKNLFPEFDSAIVDQRFSELYGVAICIYGGSESVQCQKNALLYLIAHLFVLDQTPDQGTQGAATSKAVGSVSTSFASPSNISLNNSFLSSTKYGQIFLKLISYRSGGVFA